MAPPKQKGQKMDLGTFLTDKSLGSWADEMEDMPVPCPTGRSGYGGGDRSTSYAGGGGFGSSASYADRGYSTREELPLPTKPPYTVHLGNMSFDATEGDIQDFFSGCSVTSVRIVEDRLDKKPKGFGYAEFATLEGLKKALELTGTQFQGRNIRVSVAEPQKDRPDAREFGDWTRKGPLPDVAGGNRRTSDRPGFGSGPKAFDNASDAGSERGGRRPFEQGDGKIRDFGNWDRKGPLAPSVPAGPAARTFDRPTSHDGPGSRRNSPAWGEGRSSDGSRPPRREFSERPPVDRAPTAPELDNQWRVKMKPDAPSSVTPVTRSPAMSSREMSTPNSPATTPAVPAAPTAPVGRPRLNLAKRTVTDVPSETPAAASSDSKASPFGAAKPVDTVAKDKEIEEKRQIAIREKKELEEKAREEKRIADDKAKEEKRLTRDAEMKERAEKGEKSGKVDEVKSPREKPNGATTENEKPAGPPPGRSYEILRRHVDDDTATIDDETEDGVEGANGVISEDKAVKPKEVTRDIRLEGGMTNGSPQQDSPADPTAQFLEEEGWNVVASKPRSNRKTSNQAARAIAS